MSKIYRQLNWNNVEDVENGETDTVYHNGPKAKRERYYTANKTAKTRRTNAKMEEQTSAMQNCKGS